MTAVTRSKINELNSALGTGYYRRSGSGVNLFRDQLDGGDLCNLHVRLSPSLEAYLVVDASSTFP